jgi:hypothetical protein
MTESELEYLRRRTAEELDIADRSPVLVAADVHRRLAMLYASRVAELRDTPPLAIARQDGIEPDLIEPMIRPQAAAAAPR